MRPGLTVALTRADPGRLGVLLEESGATVVHVPLIATAAPLDPAPLQDALAGLAGFDWLVVTAVAGALAVGGAAADHRRVRLAAVGRTTATRLASLAGRPVDLVPADQRAAGLVAEFPDAPGLVLVAQADRAAPTLVDGLRERGADVTAVVAYRTVLRPPDAGAQAALSAADVVVLASGSAAEAWALGGGAAAGQAVVAIGPTTAADGARHGVGVTVVAHSPSDADVIAAIEQALGG